MNEDLKNLLNRVPTVEDFDLKETIDEIEKGQFSDLEWLVEDLLEKEPSKDVLCWTRDLYLWLTKNMNAKFNFEVIVLNHLIDPNLAYTRAEVKQFLKYNSNYAARAYVCLAKAILSDDTLYKDYHQDVERFFNKMSEDPNLDTCSTMYLTSWWHLTHLHPEFFPTIEQFRSFVRSLNEQFDDMTDPILATKYLDYAFEYAKRDLIAPDMEVALQFLSKHGSADVLAYYKGLYGLFSTDYQVAYASFCQGSDQRCRLAQAYCLINGIGTVGDCQAGLRILEDYPEVAYALYLKGVGLLRDSPDGAVPAESVELLMAAFEKGYRPALYDLSILRLLHGDNYGLAAKVNVKHSLQIAMAAEDEMNQASTMAKLYLQMKEPIQRILADPKKGAFLFNTDYQSELDESIAVYKEFESHVVSVQLPLWAYTKYFADVALLRELDAETLRIGIFSICQSPRMRKWATLLYFDYAIRNPKDVDFSMLTLLLRHMGLTEKELAVCTRFWQLFTAENYGMTFYRMAENFIEDNAGTDSAFVKLLLAWLYTSDSLYMRDWDKVSGYLAETMQVQGDLLKAFHNRMSIEIIKEDYYVEFDEPTWFGVVEGDWLKDLMGYSFFDHLECH